MKSYFVVSTLCIFALYCEFSTAAEIGKLLICQYAENIQCFTVCCNVSPIGLSVLA
jgi:hypothetical protein